jgi:hypothetical protein
MAASNFVLELGPIVADGGALVTGDGLVGPRAV